jgi:hypothetical protein
MGTHRYRIVVSGGLGRIGREVFSDLEVDADAAHTALTGDLDQADLYDVLARIQDLGMELIGIIRLPSRTPAAS